MGKKYDEYPDKKVETEEMVSPFAYEEFEDTDSDQDDTIEERTVFKEDPVIKEATATNVIMGVIKYCREHKVAGIGDFLRNNWGKILGGVGALAGGAGTAYGISELIRMDENEFAESLRDLGVSEANINMLRNKAKSMGDAYKELYEDVSSRFMEISNSTPNEFDAKNQLNQSLSMDASYQGNPPMMQAYMGADVNTDGVEQGRSPVNAGPLDLAGAAANQGLDGEITPQELIKLLQLSGHDVSGMLR